MKLLLIYKTGKTEEIGGVAEPPTIFRHALTDPQGRHGPREFTFVRTAVYSDRGHLIYVENN
jgi:hypothetical protein